MARATSSLPVPLSPRISTVASVLATCSINSRTFRMGGLWPTISLIAGHFVDGSPQLQVLLVQSPLGQGLGHHVAELLRIDRLGDVIRRAQFQGPDRRIDGGIGRDHDHDRRGRGAADLLRASACRPCPASGRQAAPRRKRATASPPVASRGIGRRLDFVAVLAEPMIERVADGELVVDDQDACQGEDIDRSWSFTCDGHRVKCLHASASSLPDVLLLRGLRAGCRGSVK